MICISRVIVATACISLVACTTLQPLPVASGVPDGVAGHIVRVGYPDGSHKDLRVIELRDGGFAGERTEHGKHERIEVRYAEIKSLESVEFSAWKTLGLAAIVLLLFAGYELTQEPIY